LEEIGNEQLAATSHSYFFEQEVTEQTEAAAETLSLLTLLPPVQK
jgi:hypothetical protein